MGPVFHLKRGGWRGLISWKAPHASGPYSHLFLLECFPPHG